MVRGRRGVLLERRCGGVWGPLEQGHRAQSRDRIRSRRGVKGMAAQQRRRAEQPPRQGPLALDRLDPIGAAVGIEAAAGAQQG